MPPLDITEGVNSNLGPALTATAGASTVPSSLKWDCSIGGLTFLYSITDQFPYKRETASFRKDRVDTERNPGEQSLDSGYWLRSQSTWHYGQGIASAEPLEVSDNEAAFRYKRGGGVNPWVPGQLSLLNDTVQSMASAGSSQYLIGVDTGVLHADGTTVKYVQQGSNSTVTWGGSVNGVTSLASDGANYYAANITGIYKGTLPSGAGSLIWNTGATTTARWVKSRLFAGIGLSLYELTGTGPTLPTALFTHPSAGWTWSDFAEGPNAIYASGHVGDTSYIYKITVNASTSTITLNQPVIVSEMPRGERVLSMYSYVGSYLIVGTSKGARVALIQTDGSLSLGPLLVESTDGCTDAVAIGSYIYVTVGSKGEAGDRVQRAGLYRIDLGTILNGNQLDYAFAADLVAPAGTAGAATQVTFADGLLWFSVNSAGVYRQTTDYVAEGWLETGRVRLGTAEPKAWRNLRIMSDSSGSGTVTGFASSADNTSPSTWSQIVAGTGTSGDQIGSLNAVAPVPLSAIYMAFKLTRGSATTTPILTGYQVKAVPAPTRSELIQVPLMCFDRETDRQGVMYGQPGSAWQRFSALKQLENAAGTVQWVDYTTGEAAEAFIEQINLTRLTPPTRGQTGSGGVIQVMLRLV